MASLMQRFINFAVGEDEAVNGLGGGDPRETISGTIGRAVQAKRWWAPAARVVVDGVFGQGHCLGQAAIEQARRDRGA